LNSTCGGSATPGADAAPDLAHFDRDLRFLKARGYVALFQVLPGACEQAVSG